jgi:enoyl-CoA hydratase/carnithine racemase
MSEEMTRTDAPLLAGRYPDELGLETVLFARHNRVAWIAINRPERANSVTVELARDLMAALDAAAGDPEVGAIVLTAEGKQFCAGADLGRLKEYLALPPEEQREPFNVRDLFPVTARMRAIPLPVIAAVNGAATAGGLDLCCAADIRIASENARFGETYVKVGMIPGNGGTHLLPLIVGPAMACELAFTGDIIDAARALEIRRVNRVVPHDRLIDAAAELAERIAALPKTAIAATKAAIYKGLRQTLDENLSEMYFAVGWLHHSDDHKEGVRAFVEKRQPQFNRTAQ